MEHYDVLVIGNDIGSLAIALYLARKMRKVLVFTEPPVRAAKRESEDISDEAGNRFTFRTPLLPPVPSPDGTGLLARYLDAFGLAGELKSSPAVSDAVVAKDGSIRRRVVRIDQFVIYLVRQYPKQRDRIHRFFADMERHRVNYRQQQEGMLANTDYTITSLMIEWGDRSLAELLGKYFTDPELIDEFLLFAEVNGLPIGEISSYNFFISFFNGMSDGWVNVTTSEDDIMKSLYAKLQIVNPKAVQNRKLKALAADASGKVVKAIDDAGKEIVAKHFVSGGDPLAFYSGYFPEMAAGLESIRKFYPGIGGKRRFGTLYLGLSGKPATAGVEEGDYQFVADPAVPVAPVRLFNQKTIEPEAASAKTGALACGFVYDEGTAVDADGVLDLLAVPFPKLKKYVVAKRLGRPRPMMTMLAEEDVRKGLSIDRQIEVESGDASRMFANLYLVGRWFRPEAGLFGIFQNALNFADQIEERLYRGEDDDEFRSLSNDEIMMMIRQNYGKPTLGKAEVHINFHIGKSDYFIRTKDKNITLHRGSYGQPDVTIYSTNDKLGNMLMKKVGIQEVMESGGFKYQGRESDLYDVVAAFKLDDFQDEETPPYQPKGKIYFAGVKILFAHLLVWSIAALLGNYLKMIWIAPFALALSAGLVYLKWAIYKKISWFEFALVGLGAAFTIAAAVWPAFNNLKRDDPLLGAIGLAFFVSWIVDRPIVYDFHKYDFRGDYAATALFKVVTNGLNLVWALIFFFILGFAYVSGERYVSVLYNMVFLGIFLTYYYPWMYVKTNIKK